MRAQVATFKASLEEFALKYRADIRRDPIFRAQFHAMCANIGVDPLASNKGTWNRLLGLGGAVAYLQSMQGLETGLARQLASRRLSTSRPPLPPPPPNWLCSSLLILCTAFFSFFFFLHGSLFVGAGCWVQTSTTSWVSRSWRPASPPAPSPGGCWRWAACTGTSSGAAAAPQTPSGAVVATAGSVEAWAVLP